LRLSGKHRLRPPAKGSDDCRAQEQIEILQQEGKGKENEFLPAKKIAELEQKVLHSQGPWIRSDRKEKRRLTLVSKARWQDLQNRLGGTRSVPKKGKAITKPGRNVHYRFKKQDSRYHLSLHIPIQTRKTRSGQKNWAFLGRRHHDPRIKNGFSWLVVHIQS